MHRLLPLLFIFSLSLADTKTVAISYFDNTSGTEEYNPLSKGLADMLITDLSNVRSLKIVEREKLESLLKEIELGDGKFIDPNTAQKLGKGLGAGYMLTGSFLIMGEVMRIDARLVDVGTGEVTMAEKITGEKDTFFELEKSLVNKLITTLNIDLSKKESRKVRKVQTESFESFNNYSSSIDAFDKGEYEKSKEFMEKAANLDEDFDLAWDKLEDIEKYIEEFMLIRQSGLEAKAAKILESLGNGNLQTLQAYMSYVVTLNSNLYKYPENKEDWDKYYTEIGKSLTFQYTVMERYRDDYGFWTQDYNGAEFGEHVYLLELMTLYFLLIQKNIIDADLREEKKLREQYGEDVYTGHADRTGYYNPGNIVDMNGKVIFKYDDLEDIIIKKATLWIKNHPYSNLFGNVKMYLDTAIQSKKELTN